MRYAIGRRYLAPARMLAGMIALIAAAGLTIQLGATHAACNGIAASLWILLRYFTILTNLLVLIVFARIAVHGRAAQRLLAGTTLSILLVGIVYAVLLDGLVKLSGGAWLANMLLHQIVPTACVLFWLGFAHKGALQYRDAVRWTAFPLLYLGYALIRGADERHYAYPFIDLGKFGASAVAINCLAIALGFLAAAAGMVWLDGKLVRNHN